MKARVTVCMRADDTFEILLNEAGRDLMVRQLQRLDRHWDHFHLDYYADPETANATDVALSVIPYRDDDRCFENGKILLRPDEWDREFFPHVLADN
jgi:hypothetical protein